MFTYMATIATAIGSKLLEQWRIPDHLMGGRERRRSIYLAGSLFDWIDNEMDIHEPKSGKGGRSPFEHLEQTMADFCCVESGPGYGDIMCVMPQTKRVWSLHSPFFRILGWVPEKHTLVGIYALRAKDAHGKNSLIGEYRKKTIDFAADNKLSDTMMPGDFNALFPK
jgi:hypothetical protein